MTPYYKKDGITIYHGDCLEIMLQLDMKFDAIIADLPYGTTANSWDVIIPFELLWVKYNKLIGNNNPIVLFGKQPFTSLLVSSNLEQFRYQWYWCKNRVTSVMNAHYIPLQNTEDILVFAKNTPLYNPQYLKQIDILKIDMGQSSVYQSKSHLPYIQKFTNYPRQRLYYDLSNNTPHPNQKPEALLQYLIRTYTNEGDIVLDNTMGSGTALVAAKVEKRKAVGIDIGEEWCEVAAKRLEGYTPKEIKNKIDITNKRLF